MNNRVFSVAMFFILFSGIFSPAGISSPRPQIDLVAVSSIHMDTIEEYGIVLYDFINDHILIGVYAKDYKVLDSHGIDYVIADRDIRDNQYYIVNAQRARDPKKALEGQKVLFRDGSDMVVKADSEQAEKLSGNSLWIRKIFLSQKPYRSGRQDFPKAEVTYNPVIDGIISNVTTGILYDYTGGLSGEWPVEIGGSDYTITSRNSYYTEGIQKATQYAYEFFEDLGLQVGYHLFSGPGSRNVIAKQTGILYPDSYYIICAHIDSMPSGSVSPGADDNGSGSVAVMMAAELFSQYQFDYSIIFALWTGEEQGLVGSYYYAQDAYNQGMDILGVVNLDMIAWDTDSTPVVRLHAKQNQIPETMVLANTMADVIDIYDLDLVPQIVSNGLTYSDHSSFWNYGYSAILGIEDDVNDFNDFYHTTNDRLVHLNLEYFMDFTKAAIGTVAHIAGISMNKGEVYRFFNTARGGHLYTVSEIERDYIMNNLPDWSYEGPKFQVYEEDVAGSSPTYRFFNTRTGIHLYTISETERDEVMQLPQWSYEGIKFYVHAGQAAGTIPVYRLFNHVRGGHLYTISETERDNVSALPQWNYEGICFYVYPL